MHARVTQQSRVSGRPIPDHATPSPAITGFGFRIGNRGDPDEHQADRLASKALGEPTPQRASGVREHAVSHDAGPAIADALSSPGHRLPTTERRFFESRMGADFSTVRIHADHRAERAARAVNANAFALGRHLVFRRDASLEAGPAARRLLAHELAHVAQEPGSRVLRRDNGTTNKPDEKKDEASPIADGLKLAAEKAAKKKDVKDKIIKPIEDKAKQTFEKMPADEKAALISFGAASYGLTIGPMLGTEKGRKHLSGVNFIAPLNLIPYWPLSSFKYNLPESDTKPLKFELTFDGTDLLKIGRKDPTFATSLSMEAKWSVLPSGDWKLDGLTATFGLIPGLKLSGGFKKGSFISGPDIISDAGGRQIQSVKSIPAAPGSESPLKGVPNVGGFVTVDLTKLSIIPEKVRKVLGGQF
jgi:hypothetical protein